jgi:hypothetical protein
MSERLVIPIGMTMLYTGGVAVLASLRDSPNRHAGKESNWLAARGPFLTLPL